MVSSILIFLLVLSILIIAHELGHFIAAKRAGIWVEEFGIGMPPRIFGKKIGETIYSINLLPFGGFVRMHGEMTEEGVSKPKRAFIHKSKKKRILIVIAGVIMNFLLAIFAFAIVYSFTGIPREGEDVRVVEVVQGSPAMEAGIEVEDIVRKLNGETITSTTQFVEVSSMAGGDSIIISLENSEGALEDVELKPRKDYPEDEGPVGITITTSEVYFPPVWQRPFIGIYYGFGEAIFWGGAVLGGFVEILKDVFVGQAPKDLAGPVGIFAVTSEAASYGFLALINFLGILSVNLAILNILPFPALDGGRLLFIGIESILGRKVLPKVEATIHTVGFIVLILILIAITTQDIKRLIEAGSLTGFVDSVLK